MSGLIVKTVHETVDTRTFFLKIKSEDRHYFAGQFLNIDPHQFPELLETIKILEFKKGYKETVRAYSVSSFPAEECISFTVKSESFKKNEDYLPLLSPFLVATPLVGRTLEFYGYAGHYILPEFLEKQTAEVLHLVSGSGIVPNFSILKDNLIGKKNLKIHHTLIIVNKTYKDIIYREELLRLANEYQDRFTLVHLLTREQKEGFLYGRPSLELINKHIRDLRSVLIYTCGSKITKWQHKHAKIMQNTLNPRFMETILSYLAQLGIDKKQIKSETYG